MIRRLWALVRKRKLDQELQEELQFHLQREAEELAQTGVPIEEAVLAARRKFGGVEQTKEIYRDARGVPLVEEFLRDVRYGLRGMRKNPGFTAVAVLSLALGIGVNCAVFTLVNAILLRNLPIKDPESYAVLTTFRQQRPGADFSYPVYRAIADSQRTLADMAASGQQGFRHVVFEGNEFQELNTITGGFVSANYFTFLGLQPALGRFFDPTDSPAPGKGHVAVIGYGFWKARFAGDPAVLGKTITVDDVPLTIVGIAPQGFRSELVDVAIDIWVPFLLEPRFHQRSLLTSRTATWFRTLGRVKPGVSLSAANAELTALYQQDVMAAGSFRGNLGDLRVEVQPRPNGLPPPARSRMWTVFRLLLAVVGVVLLIACCNVANLMLARASARQREIGIRLAVGSSRRRLIGQLLTESILLSGIGGMVGYFAAREVARALAAGIVPASVDLAPDWRVLSFTAGVSLMSALIFGLAPALQTTRTDLDAMLRTASRGQTGGKPRQRTSRALVVAQVGLSVWLLVGAGLMIRTLQNLRAQDVGVDRKNVISLVVSPERAVPQSRYADLRARMEQRLKSVPGVEAVSFAMWGLFSASATTAPVRVPGSNVEPSGDPDIRTSSVTPEFFRTMGIKPMLGRVLTEADARARVGVINEVVARHYFGSANPVGQMVYFPKIDTQNRYLPFGTPLDPEQGFEIVGVVRDTRSGLREEPIRMMYKPLPVSEFPTALYVRTADEAESHAAPILQVLREFNREVAVTEMISVNRRVEQSADEERFLVRFLSTFGALALVLAGVGLFGVLSYAVARRTSEIGIRMALGARRGEVVAMILRETLWLVLTGIALGIFAALASSRIISQFMYGLSANDPGTIVGVSGILIAVAMLAGFVPARRASRVDPVVALHNE